MSDNYKPNFVQVNYDLLASKKLNSTQKLFISYIIGWQKNELICKETNKNLATRFGKKYSGIRAILNELNKYDFFNSVQKDYDEKNRTSGHEITVNEAKLKLFLNDGKKENNNSSIKPEAETNIQSEAIPEATKENSSILQYHNSDIVNVKDTMIYLGFSNDEAEDFKAKIKSENLTFYDFGYALTKISLAQKRDEYIGIRISEEQNELFTKMFLDEI